MFILANVILEGIYLGSNIKSNTYNGETRSRLEIDIYQPDADRNKQIIVRANDLELKNIFDGKFKMSSPIKMKVSTNAYQNQVYFNLEALL